MSIEERIEERIGYSEEIASHINELKLERKLYELEKRLYEYTAIPNEIIKVDEIISLLRGISFSEESYNRIREVLDATVRPKGSVNISLTHEQAKKYLLNFEEYFSTDKKKPKEFIEEKEMKL